MCLLIKDHKKPDKNGDYPSRLVVPAKNFMAGFPHVGQHGIKKILDRNSVYYSRKTIVQASDLKQKLEKIDITRSGHTIASIDAKTMYPLVRFEHIKQAVDFFSRGISEEDKRTINRCLEMVKFGMANTIVTFKDEYWDYCGAVPVEHKELTIGGYESAFLQTSWPPTSLRTRRTFLRTQRTTESIVTMGSTSSKASSRSTRCVTG